MLSRVVLVSTDSMKTTTMSQWVACEQRLFFMRNQTIIFRVSLEALIRHPAPQVRNCGNFSGHLSHHWSHDGVVLCRPHCSTLTTSHYLRFPMKNHPPPSLVLIFAASGSLYIRIAKILGGHCRGGAIFKLDWEDRCRIPSRLECKWLNRFHVSDWWKTVRRLPSTSFAMHLGLKPWKWEASCCI